jgi:ankyrin repeat protein
MKRYRNSRSDFREDTGILIFAIFAGVIAIVLSGPVTAQSAPSAREIESMSALHAAAHAGEIDQLQRLIGQGSDLESTDQAGRTALHVAAFASQIGAIETLAAAGADLDALEYQAYDIVTIASVANDVELLDLALSLGASAKNITSPYEGTALIAASHLGHHKIVRLLIDAGAPLNHVNNLGWTALIEAVILGNGGPNHIETVRALINAGADRSITDRDGLSPLQHAEKLNYSEIVELLQ